ncbi:MAG: glycosyltransferase family 2 protein [Prevotellaceae bacterium]|jgi:glycosyltransferase involved in cell wall biosynthesis|nr:glycosyltransferase family 2 protein [Prevotellaceae bacterium]
MTPAVSILVPVYNVSNFIERCAHSLFQQTFEDIEYVFVNDCTPDDSIEKLQKVMAQYPNRNVKIIHHEKNRGLAAARNTAIDHSTGKYIQVIDSDDWVEADMIENLYKKAEEEQADILVSDILMEKKNATIYQKEFIEYKNKTPFQIMLENEVIGGYLWAKFVKRELYVMPECRVIEGLNYLEDLHVSIRMFYFANKIVKIDRTFYHYNKTNENAITSQKTDSHFATLIVFWKYLDEFLQANSVKCAESIAFLKIHTKVNLITQTNSYKTRKKYAYLFRDFEMKYINRFRLGERLILFFTHYRMFFSAHLTYKLIILKNQRIPKTLCTCKLSRQAGCAKT